MRHELDRRIERLTNHDPLRDYIFEQANLFAIRDAEYVNWDLLEDGSPIHNVYSYFKDLVEYLKIRRPDNINRLLVAELNFESALQEDPRAEQDLIDMICDIENEDSYHLTTIISLRQYINYAS